MRLNDDVTISVRSTNAPLIRVLFLAFCVLSCVSHIIVSSYAKNYSYESPLLQSEMLSDDKMVIWQLKYGSKMQHSFK